MVSRSVFFATTAGSVSCVRTSLNMSYWISLLTGGGVAGCEISMKWVRLWRASVQCRWKPLCRQLVLCHQVGYSSATRFSNFLTAGPIFKCSTSFSSSWQEEINGGKNKNIECFPKLFSKVLKRSQSSKYWSPRPKINYFDPFRPILAIFSEFWWFWSYIAWLRP